MTYLSDSGQSVSVHDHPADQTCHWVAIFKPLSFIVFRDAQLFQSLLQSTDCQLNACDFSSYAQWLCRLGKNGLLNLINVFLLMYDVCGHPSLW
jgi:hypothetical protein